MTPNDSKPSSVTIARPDDWHVHLRDGPMLRAIVPFTAERFGRAIIMPNLTPPVTDVAAAEAYRERIMAAVPEGMAFKPLMTCYLTDDTDADQITLGFANGVFAAAKLYPAHATTNSAHGVTDIARIKGVLARMEGIGMPLLVHGEVTDPDVDVFDREAVFIERVLEPLLKDFPGLNVVLEHITTADAAEFVRGWGDSRLAATITAHHLMINRNAIFKGGLRPHMYCLPIAKRERHRLALRQAATSGNPAFFLGTDTAPHRVGDKEADCGCAGIFTAPAAIELYAQVFSEDGALDKLDGFASRHGPAFYGLPVNEETVTLVRDDWTVAEYITLEGGGPVKPFLAGETLNWRLAD